MSALETEVGNLEIMVNSSLIVGILWLIRYDYAHYTTSPLIISHYAQTKRSYWYQRDIVDEVLKNFLINYNEGFIKLHIESDPANPIDTYTHHLYSKNFHRKDKAIWFVDSWEAYLELEEDIQEERTYYHRNGWFTMIYNGVETYPLVLDLLEKIFKRLFDLYVLNINVFLPQQNTKVYTYFPFQPHVCRWTKPKLVLEFEPYTTTLAKNYKIFQLKLNNIYQCELLISTWNQDPFVFVEYDNITKKVTNLHGIEGSIMALVAERLNFSLQISNPEKLDRGGLLENGTLTGVVQLVHEGLTNITMNSYQLDETRVKYMLPSVSHMSSDSIVAVPEGMPMTSWERLTRGFAIKVWLAFGGTLLFSILLIFALKIFATKSIQTFIFGRRNRIPFTNL